MEHGCGKASCAGRHSSVYDQVHGAHKKAMSLNYYSLLFKQLAGDM